MFTQILDPTGNLFVTWLVALVPVVLLLFLLAGLRTFGVDRRAYRFGRYLSPRAFCLEDAAR